MYAQMGLAVASSVLGTMQKNANLKAQYKAIEQQHELNVSITRSMLNTLDMRVNRQSSEITRDKLRTQRDIQAQATTAVGESRVQAAQIGVTGRRASLAVSQGIERKAADLMSDAQINAETEQWNLIQSHQDQASRAIANLNNSIPNIPQADSPWLGVVGAVQTGANVYFGSDKFDKAKFKQYFSSESTPEVANITESSNSFRGR